MQNLVNLESAIMSNQIVINENTFLQLIGSVKEGWTDIQTNMTNMQNELVTLRATAQKYESVAKNMDDKFKMDLGAKIGEMDIAMSQIGTEMQKNTADIGRAGGIVTNMKAVLDDHTTKIGGAETVVVGMQGDIGQMKQIGVDMKTKIQEIDQKIVHIEQGIGQGARQGGHGERREYNMLESKMILNIGIISGDKSAFRRWNQKFISIIYGIKSEYGDYLAKMQNMLDTGTEVNKMEEEIGNEMDMKGSDREDLNRFLYTVLMMKVEGEAYDKIRGVTNRKGMVAYGQLYRWFTEISGLGLAEQARRLIQPESPKKEEDIAEYVDLWEERINRLEAHGDEYKLSSLYKVTALRQLMVGKAIDHFEIWQASIKPENDQGFRELIGKVKDFARRKRLDQAVLSGKAPMDIGQAKVEDLTDDQWEELNIGAVQKGKGKGKGGGFKGKCYACGEYGHSQWNCPKFPKGIGKGGKDGGKGEGKGKGKGK